MRELIAAAFLLTASQQAAVAGDEDLYSFGYLYKLCIQGHDYCLGFVTGVGGVMSINGYANSGRFELCTYGKALRTDAMVQAVINIGRDHPDFWTDPMLSGTIFALSTTWPCPPK